MTTSPKPAPPGDRLFALIASISGSGSVDWCDRVRALLDEVRAEAVAPATDPVCKSTEGCHRVVACDPGCAVTAARMYAKLAAAQSAATDQTTPSRQAGLRAEIANALEAADYRMDMRRGDLADAVLPVLYREWPWLRAEAEGAVLPAPVDRTACNCDAEVHAGMGFYHQPQCATRQSSMADEPQQPTSTAPLAAGLPLVKGNCPACQRASLFLGSGGYVTCSNSDCQEPDAASTVLEQYGSEAHPPEHTWAAELRDPLADEWVPGTRYSVRDRAVNALEHAKRIGPAWKDGSPTERRLVRATTTYTVESQQPAEPEAGAQWARTGGFDQHDDYRTDPPTVVAPQPKDTDRGAEQ